MLGMVCIVFKMSDWPSGLRRQIQALFPERGSVGSNPTSDKIFFGYICEGRVRRLIKTLVYVLILSL